MSEATELIIIGASIPSIITIIGLLFNYISQKKEREFNFNKEKYFYIVNKIELIIGGITHMNISQIHSVSHYNQNYIGITINENKVYAQISSDEIKNILNYAIIYSPEMHSEIAILVGVYNKIITSLNNKDSVSEVNELANNFTNKRRTIQDKLQYKVKNLEKNII